MNAVETLESPQPDLLPKDKQSFSHVTDQQVIELFGLLEDGDTVRTAAEKVGLNRRTAYRVLARYDADLSAVDKLLKVKALSVAEDWIRASEKAADKGDHRPAKDLLLHARAIEPVHDGSQGTNIAIIIGTPDAPIRVAAPQQVVVEAVGSREGE